MRARPLMRLDFMLIIGGSISESFKQGSDMIYVPFLENTPVLGRMDSRWSKCRREVISIIQVKVEVASTGSHGEASVFKTCHGRLVARARGDESRERTPRKREKCNF